jgi:hypothetical protein
MIWSNDVVVVQNICYVGEGYAAITGQMGVRVL